MPVKTRVMRKPEAPPGALAIPAFNDNYFWLLENDGRAVVVDPGDAEVVLAVLRDRQLQLDTILITHHHADHIGGVPTLRRVEPAVTVYGPEDSRIPVDRPVGEKAIVSLPALNRTFQVLEVPGHTRSHIAYYDDSELFCGDTLFVCGCGRLFEGTPKQMHASLSKIRQLPDNTRVHCAHEYTLDNMEFARWVEPENKDLQDFQAEAKELRRANTPTVPSLLGREKQCNPFLRFDQPDVIDAAHRHVGRARTLKPYEVFGAIRHWKDAEFD